MELTDDKRRLRRLVVDKKLADPRHRNRKGPKLTRAQMLAIILYTGK